MMARINITKKLTCLYMHYIRRSKKDVQGFFEFFEKKGKYQAKNAC